MIYVYYLLAALLVYLSCRSLRGGIAYLRYFKQELARPPSVYSPFATVIVPCKGLDQGLTANLSALLMQDYPAYEVIFAVDDKRDSAVPVIEELLHRRKAEPDSPFAVLDSQFPADEIPVSTKFIIASKAARSSRKAGVLRDAVLHASPASRVLVFADSDARPSAGWLRGLVAPLEDETVGASTGYRWYISPARKFASELRSVWNASVASSLGPNSKSNFCWGGATAVRRETFDRLEIREKWSNIVSEDFTLTRAVNAAGMTIYFVPRAMTASVEDCSFRELLEFTTRQMKITRVYARSLWVGSFVGSFLFITVILASLGIVSFGRPAGIDTFIAMLTISVVLLLGIIKAALRLRAIRLAMPEHEDALRKQILSQTTLWALTPIIFFYNSVAALFSRTITWRGVSYEMVSADKTIVAGETLSLRRAPSK